MKEADFIELPPMPDVGGFSKLRMSLRENVAAASTAPEQVFKWIQAVEHYGMTCEKLQDSEGFVSLDIKLCAALTKKITGDVPRTIQLLKKRYAREGRLLKGRQYLWHVYRYFATDDV